MPITALFRTGPSYSGREWTFFVTNKKSVSSRYRYNADFDATSRHVATRFVYSVVVVVVVVTDYRPMRYIYLLLIFAILRLHTSKADNNARIIM